MYAVCFKGKIMHKNKSQFDIELRFEISPHQTNTQSSRWKYSPPKLSTHHVPNMTTKTVPHNTEMYPQVGPS